MVTNVRKKFVFIYIISILFYVYIVLSAKRSYQDSWILQDILIPTIIYIFIFITSVIIIDNNRMMALICSSFVIILNIIPSLKYDLFYGIADTTFHYRFVSDIMNNGYVPKYNVYSGSPGMHILVSISSLFLGISTNTGFKYIIPTMYGIFPLIVYFISNKLIYDKILIKYIIIASSLPTITAYYYSGTIFPLPILFLLGPLLIIGEIVDIQNRNKYRIITVVILMALLISHTMTPLLFLVFSAGSILLLTMYNKYQQNVWTSILIKRLYALLIFAVVLFIFWWMYESDFLFSTFVKSILQIIESDSSSKIGVIPHRFFEISIEDKIKILAVSHLKDIIIGLLCMLGFLIYAKKKEKLNNNTKILYLYTGSFLATIIFLIIWEFLANYDNLEYQRFINYATIFSPFFVGLSFYQLKLTVDKKFGLKIRNMILVSILYMIIIFSIIQFYPYQPIVPNANIILKKDLPDNEPLTYFQHVNTIYQEKMIIFSSNHFSLNDVIISDTITRLQMIAFFNLQFNYSRYVWDSPLTSKIEKWDLLLLHWNGVSGPFLEQAEYRTKDKLLENRDGKNRNVIYDNGESFIIRRQN